MLNRLSLLTSSVILVAISGIAAVVAGSAAGFMAHTDVGYPDSANMLRIRDVAESGRIYPRFDEPPYMVTLYGPLTYVLLSLPFKLAAAFDLDPRIAVRTGIFAAFLSCLTFVFLIAVRVYGSRATGSLAVVFAASVSPLGQWTTQIRGDFLAAGFSLMSIYLVLGTRWPPALPVGAVCAGGAMLVKQTFVAAPTAVMLWLLLRRRFRQAFVWFVTVFVTTAGGYAAAWWREPLLLEHLTALRTLPFEYRGALSILVAAVSHPLVPFAVVGGLLAACRGRPGAVLLALFSCVSWLVAVAILPQAGSNINYFWEPLFAAAVLAGGALVEVDGRFAPAWGGRNLPLVVVFLWACIPVVRDDIGTIRRTYAESVRERSLRGSYDSFTAAVSGRRLLSTVPWVMALSRSPEVPDPYLNSSLALGGTWSYEPIVERVRAREYDVVAVYRGELDLTGGYRGVPAWPAELREAVKDAYQLACVFDRLEVWVPPDASEQLRSRLPAAACHPIE